MNEQALKAISRALEINPDEAEYWYHQSTIFYFNTDYSKALESINQAIEIQTSDDVNWYWQGIILFEMKVMLFLDRKEKALKAFEKAIELKPDNAEYWYWKSRCLVDLFEEKKALKAIKKSDRTSAREF